MGPHMAVPRAPASGPSGEGRAMSKAGCQAGSQGLRSWSSPSVASAREAHGEAAPGAVPAVGPGCEGVPGRGGPYT